VDDILAAQRYSKAIFSILDSKNIDTILADIKLMRASLQEEVQLTKDINSYLLPLDKRMNIALEIADKFTNSDLWRNLFKILIKKHRFNILLVILADLENKILDDKNQIKVKLTVSRNLKKSVLENISEKLKSIINKDIILDVNIDPAILGGFIASTNSLLIDGSIKHNLVKLLTIKDKKEMRSV